MISNLTAYFICFGFGSAAAALAFFWISSPVATGDGAIDRCDRCGCGMLSSATGWRCPECGNEVEAE